MNFSSLTGLDIAVLVVLAISVIAVITVIFLLMFVNKKLYTEVDFNRDVTMRFKASRSSASANVEVIESKHNTQFGTIAFVNGNTDAQMKAIEADIVVNGGPVVSFTGLTKATSGTLKFLNNTDADLTIKGLTFFPGNIDSNFTTDTLMNTILFDHYLLVKGKITNCNFVIQMADNSKYGQMNVDLTLSRNKS
uniref:Wsv311-like protein n=1 Tax=Sesarmops intermedium nimavirus TaxID=2133796 RepID=A0A401IPP4_9VIRU|nr:MAG: wsv311-like protein [Sesarmops intermedium nimavirus]GBG35586.1 wsv311-like protein [Sesarmops intermedium nimavirus]